MRHTLLFSVFVVASCGLAYELIAAALSSYVLGDSVTQFSTVIGTYLFAMGVGSWLSRYIERGLAARFVQIEILVGVIGGFSALILFLVFAHLSGPFRLVLYGLVFVTGMLVGLEIPLIMRILRRELVFKEVVSQVLTFDYLGALAVSIAFPLILAPHLGLMRTGLLFGIFNVLIAFWAIKLFGAHQEVAAAAETPAADASPAHPAPPATPAATSAPQPAPSQAAPDIPAPAPEQRVSIWLPPSAASFLHAQGIIALLLLLGGFVFADKLTALAEEGIYADQIIHAESTPYQRIVVTRWRDDLRLHLNGNLQFSSRDEYRYHDALVHPALATLPGAKRVLILGGGDGLAAREVLRYPQIESITLVDLDRNMTNLFAKAPMLTALNQHALSSPKVKVLNQDALLWLEQNPDMFDLILIDFPDPSNFSLGKLYSSAFYRLLEKHLSATGLAVIQATSPYYARKSFWCIVATLEDAGLRTAPYHAYVPSFGEWGYIIAGRGEFAPPATFAVTPRSFDGASLKTMFAFAPDMARVPVEVNRLNNQILVRYFEEEWRRVMR